MGVYVEAIQLKHCGQMRKAERSSTGRPVKRRSYKGYALEVSHQFA